MRFFGSCSPHNDALFYVWVSTHDAPILPVVNTQGKWTLDITTTTNSVIKLVFYRWCLPNEPSHLGEFNVAQFIHQGVITLQQDLTTTRASKAHPCSIMPPRRSDGSLNLDVEWNEAIPIVYDDYTLEVPVHWKAIQDIPPVPLPLTQWKALSESPPIQGYGRFKDFLRLYQKDFDRSTLSTGIMGIPMMTYTSITPDCWTRHIFLASALLGIPLSPTMDAPTMTVVLQIALGSIGFDSTYTEERVDDTSTLWSSLNKGRDCEDKVIAVIGATLAILAMDTGITDSCAAQLTKYLQQQWHDPSMLVGWLRIFGSRCAPHAWMTLLPRGTQTPPLFVECTAPFAFGYQNKHMIPPEKKYLAIAGRFTPTAAYALQTRQGTVGITTQDFYRQHYQEKRLADNTLPTTCPFHITLGKSTLETTTQQIRRQSHQLTLDDLKDIPLIEFPVQRAHRFIPLDSIKPEHRQHKEARLFINTKAHSGILLPL